MQNKLINIMLIADKLPLGGAEMVVYNLALNLDKDKFKAYVCCLEGLGEIGERLKGKGIDVIDLGSQKGMDLFLPFKLARILKDKNIQIIHAHNSTALRHSVIAARLTGISIVIQTRHGDEFSRQTEWRRHLGCFLSNRAINIVTICEHLKNKIIQNEKINSTKLTVIHNGIDVEKYRNIKNDNVLLQEFGLDKDDFIFINVANIRPEKGQDILINAFSAVTKGNKNAKLLIVGGESDKRLAGRLHDLIRKLSLEKQVIFLGQREDVAELLLISDVFVLPSLTEGMPMSILEAMACGKPVIATRVGGMPEIIVDNVNGLLIEPKNEAALIDSMLELLKNGDKRKKLAKSSQDSVIEKFDIKTMLKNYENLYKATYIKTKSKICLVAPFPPPIGGMSNQAEILAKNLARENTDLTCIKANPLFKGLINIKGIRTLAKLTKLIFELIIKTRKCKVVYIFACSYTYFFLVVIPSVMITKFHRKKAIINYHGGLFEKFFKTHRFIVKSILNKADLVTVPSPYLKELMETAGIKAVVVPNIIATENFLFKKRETILPKIIVTRHHNKDYNVECAIRAFGIVKKNFPGARLTLVGSGTQTADLKNLVKQLGLADVSFLGALGNGKLPHILAENDIFLNTSLVDNLPVSFLEAFSAGLLVVSTPTGGIPYLVNDGVNGFLSQSAHPEDVAAKIQEALNSENQGEKIIDNARQTVMSYTWQEAKKDLLEVLEI